MEKEREESQLTLTDVFLGNRRGGSGGGDDPVFRRARDADASAAARRRGRDVSRRVLRRAEDFRRCGRRGRFGGTGNDRRLLRQMTR